MKKQTYEDLIIDIIDCIILITVLIITVFPFYYILVLSFNTGIDTVRAGGLLLYPRDFTIRNYSELLGNGQWLNALFITVSRTVAGTFLGVLFTSLVAYGLAYKKLVFRKFYFGIILISMYFSGGLIPFYVLLKSLGLINNFLVYIIPTMISQFYILIMVAFFRELPEELSESAYIDGANDLTIFFKIIIPVSIPAIATLTLFFSVGQWNSWFDSAYYIHRKSLKTLMNIMIEIINKNLALQNINTGTEAIYKASEITPKSLQAAAIIIAIAPILTVYPFLQKYFVKGIMLGSVKG